MRARLSYRTAALLRRALAGRDPSSEDVDALERLDRLQQIQARSRRGALAAIVIGVLLALVSVASMKVRSTWVSLEVSSSLVSFTVDERSPLLSPGETLLLGSLQASGLDRIDHSRFAGEGEVYQESPLSGRWTSMPGTSDGLTLEPPVVIPGERVHLETRRDGPGYVMEIACDERREAGADVPADEISSCGEQDVRLSFLGEISYDVMGLATRVSRQVVATTPEAFVMHRGSGEAIRLEIAPTPRATSTLVWQVPVRELSFEDVESLELSDDQPVKRRYSGLVAGTLRFDSLPGHVHEIWRGEYLRLAGTQGLLQTVELEDGSLRVGFTGKVAGVTQGGKDMQRSLMPSWLDWAFARSSSRTVIGFLISALLISLGLGRLQGIEG